MDVLLCTTFSLLSSLNLKLCYSMNFRGFGHFNSAKAEVMRTGFSVLSPRHTSQRCRPTMSAVVLTANNDGDIVG